MINLPGRRLIGTWEFVVRAPATILQLRRRQDERARSGPAGWLARGCRRCCATRCARLCASPQFTERL